ncbi:SF3a splicing factor complex subunit [Arthrobotrys conoides]|uniref:SF3a splicing factor complex subunit n=1 Tax=Arthrobotrys conoides TaxID=74498 RepID=A0AAN8RQU7_9PEZI
MAPSAADVPPPITIVSNEEAAKAPAGVVLPPKEIRAIVEKTAGYVARNGEAFEMRIRDKERTNPKFSFLTPGDPYNPFYVWRLEETRAGRSTAVAAGRTDGGAAPAPEPEPAPGPTPPPEFQFSARMPAISAQDLDVLRLTALFVAKNGRQFMTTLSQREARNYQFDFLRPNHSFYQYFTRLVDQYTLILSPTDKDERMEQLRKNFGDKFQLIDAAKQRSEWVKHQEEEKKKMEEEEDKEKLAYAQIDWHDFAIVETITFTEADDHADLPPPTSLSDLQHASLEQKALMSLNSNQLRIEEAMPTAEDYDSGTYIPEPMQEEEEEDETMDVAMEPDSDNEDEEMARIRERREAQARAEQARAEAQGGTAPMKIRSDYVPRAATAAANRRGAAQTTICPNCKQPIPLDELEQHMRIELLDPRWKEQRARADAKYSTTNLSTTDVAANLKRLASQRADLFDVQPGVTDEGDERRKKPVIAWDGHADSREAVRLQQLQSVSMTDQLSALQKKQQEFLNPTVGPRRN